MALTYGKQSPQEMLAKAERDLAQLEAAEAAQKKEELSDALFNLAVSLTSVKDWLKEQTNAPFTPDTVESYVSASVALSSFRDIANAGKHRIIRKYVPTTEDVTTSAIFVEITTPTTSQVHPSSWFRLKIIRRDDSRHGAVQLGRTAVQEWKSFMRQYALIA